MLTSTDFTGLINRRFFYNFLPIPATNQILLGGKAPDFRLPDITNNRKVRLGDYFQEKPVILAFTRIFTEKQYCPFCYPHILSLNKYYERFIERGVDVLMITSTDAKQSEIVVRDLGLKMPLLSNPDCRVFRMYHTGQALGAPLPAQFVLDKTGKVQYKHLFSFIDHNASVDQLLLKIS
ncbi:MULTISPECIES: peroxiredoxin family protein [Crocosphaera]|uniref:Alkyl hydroperoxide reductase subunit C-like protein n=4 Tax=Crocosphaera watsonii TaxID=263511 RepID=T2IUA5_CROWT|nr:MULTISPECIES: peroxiredoxin family protein [Crocosphaera]EHJ11296.1 putative thiol-specific antioxidant protein [Crocosphaera watsonii WH 0003]MCH2243159.1 peroxiredoxin family protein [Crocosphaera sp.]NQZ61303.1 redoxin domain-containing protein [Crocosphaera sp.]CCQ55735.1 Alkyl hydroperoxide reductase subunit C-like protein [Crocosphaera watsonii WH 0005]CCQ62974.1 putative thiol-specific antioxidant protein [Crocosphaera watsonii WH 0401]